MIPIKRSTSGQNSGDRVDWLDSFAQALAKEPEKPKTAVEAARERDRQSLFDQISSIVSRQRICSTVEDRVQQYQEATGLKEYINRMSIAAENQKKTAAAELPKSFDHLTEDVRSDIKVFIRNKCETHHGNIQVPAIVEDVSKVFRQRGVQPQDVNEPEFEKYISDQIAETKRNQPSSEQHSPNLGKGVGIDHDSSDLNDNNNMWDGLMPVKR